MDPDLLRIAAIILGGGSVGAAVVAVRQIVARANRAETFSVRLFLGIHVSIVLFVAGVLAESANEPLSWRTPVAMGIFAAKIVALLSIREIMLGKELREDPPSRRAEDHVIERIKREFEDDGTIELPEAGRPTRLPRGRSDEPDA